MSQIDLHAQDGFVVTLRDLDEQVCELAFDFPALPRDRALVRSLALVYLALFRRGVPFVAHSPTLRVFAVRREDLGPPTRQALLDAIALVRREITRLSACAELFFHDRPDQGPLEPDPAGVLRAYRDGELVGKRFLDSFAQELTGLGLALP